MEISEITKKYWEDADWADIEKTEEIADMSAIAWRILKRMPDNLVQICGPIGTGGKGSVEANLAHFNECVKSMQSKGFHIFDQMPFEAPMQKLKAKLAPNEYPVSILTDFYQPIFESGKISTFYFMPGWQSSKGATWEHGLAEKLGMKIVYLEE